MPDYTADDGCRIHYEDTGSGPPCLFIPGLGGSGAFWRPVWDGLGSPYRTITLDHRGAGESGASPNGHSIPRIAKDAIGLLDALGIPKAHIVGHSTGGMIAQHMAVMAPERVDRLVLSGTWDRPTRRFRLMFEARLALLRQAGFHAYTLLTQAIGYDAATLEARAAALDRELEAARDVGPLPAHEARLQMLLDEPGLPDLGAITQPTLVVSAPDDAMLSFDNAERLAAGIPGAKLVALKGGHFFPAAYPEPYCAALTAFLGAPHVG